jgi:nicotinamidase-related amidase
MNETALLIIDAQVNMFAAGSSVFEGEKILNTLCSMVFRARAARMLVIYVQNNGTENDPDMPGTLGWQIHPALTPEKGDLVIQKNTPDSFHGTTLQNELDSRHIQNLIVAGMQTEYCINATCRRALEVGYKIILVQDAHSTYDGSTLTAPQIIAQYNHDLGGIVKLQNMDDIVFG